MRIKNAQGSPAADVHLGAQTLWAVGVLTHVISPVLCPVPAGNSTILPNEAIGDSRFLQTAPYRSSIIKDFA